VCVVCVCVCVSEWSITPSRGSSAELHLKMRRMIMIKMMIIVKSVCEWSDRLILTAVLEVFLHSISQL